MAKRDGIKIDIPGMSAMQALKFGPGVIGRSAPIPVAFAIVVLAAIWAVHDRADLVMWLVLICLIALAAFFGCFVWYGHTHPENALLEGATAVEYKKLELEQSAKSPQIIDGSSRPVANTSPPPSITGGLGA